jgi:hypothetical protein
MFPILSVPSFFELRLVHEGRAGRTLFLTHEGRRTDEPGDRLTR